MDLESFLGFELNSGFGPFFCFYRQRIDLARFMGCFLSVLGQQWVENMFLSQTKKPCFLATLVAELWAKWTMHHFFFWK
jgi:hypothetical protein